MLKPFLPAIALATVLGAVLTAGATLPAQAQTQAAGLGGVASTQTVTVRAKVRGVNMKTREVTLVGPTGDVFTVHAGDAVRNLAQVKAGNTVVARYLRSSVVVLSQPGQPLPPDTLTVAGGRAAQGQMPAGVAGAKLVLTGTVVGVDLAAHTLQLVNPKGGRVVTVDVADPQRQQDMTHVKVGDSLTVVYTEAVAVAVDPTH